MQSNRGIIMKKKIAAGVLVAGFSFGVVAGSASAGQPAKPGCFGADRAAFIQGVQAGGVPGASEVGIALSDRAGENSTINQTYVCI